MGVEPERHTQYQSMYNGKISTEQMEKLRIKGGGLREPSGMMGKRSCEKDQNRQYNMDSKSGNLKTLQKSSVLRNSVFHLHV